MRVGGEKLADREPEAPVISTFRPERRTDLDITTDGMCSLAYEPTLGWTRDACKHVRPRAPTLCDDPVRRSCARRPTVREQTQDRPRSPRIATDSLAHTNRYSWGRSGWDAWAMKVRP